ncbi:MAG: secondary thiamine-phosphate synthase enzyme YjbQ [Syntrophales bacterium]|nr:secondary thiamine-phosphate synthase enzyme YjbQ [Syntrophales bacterium]
MDSFTVTTRERCEMIDITKKVRDIVSKQKISTGLVCIFVPHTTAAVTINENADPDVPRDILNQLNRLIPKNAPFLHCEGNSDAHVKASLVGSSELVIVSGGELMLGQWQSIFFCEFDGPRTRRVYVEVVGSKP